MIIEFFSHHYHILLSFLLIAGFVAGFVDAIAGGGGLISIPALMVTGMPIVLVLGTNKLQSSIGTSIAVFNYYRNGLFRFGAVYKGLVMGFLGAWLGVILVNHISNDFMKIIALILMIMVFAFNLFNSKIGVENGKKRLKESLFFSLFGFVLGFYDSFFGPGTGNFWLILIVFFLGYNFLEASGYAKILNLKSNLISLATFLFFHKVNFILGFTMAIGQIFGNYIGVKFAILKGSKLIKPIFMVIILTNILAMGYNLIEPNLIA
jgi:cupin 2 domain-containing protein